MNEVLDQARIAMHTVWNRRWLALGIAWGVCLLGWLIGQVFVGRPLGELVTPILLIAAIMVLRGAAEHWRAVLAHETAARVQKALRRTL